jgi:putative transposase
MRYTHAEKLEIIRLVEGSDLPAKRTLAQLGVSKSTFYEWYRRYRDEGAASLAPQPSQRRRYWNRIPDAERERLVEVALEKPELSARELAWHITDNEGYFISERSVYRILKDFDLVTSPAYIVMSAADEFKHKTKRVHELWQTDFTYFKIVDWGWYYLSTVLDDYSRYIVSWRLTTSMTAKDVTATLDDALAKTGLEQMNVRHRPRLLSDNGPCYISKDLGDYLDKKEMDHTRGAPYHPQTQGKIERWHQTLKNRILLENYFLPGDLKASIGAFVTHYNHQRYHESLSNLTPADIYFGRGQTILLERERIKRDTINQRRLQHRKAAA